MNYFENVHDIDLLPVENVGSAAFPLFPRSHGSGAGLQPGPAQKIPNITRGQIPFAAANPIPGFPCFWRKLGALSAFSLFPLECKVPSADPSALSRGILSTSGSQWKVLKSSWLGASHSQKGNSHFPWEEQWGGNRDSLWNELGRAPRGLHKLIPGQLCGNSSFFHFSGDKERSARRSWALNRGIFFLVVFNRRKITNSRIFLEDFLNYERIIMEVCFPFK